MECNHDLTVNDIKLVDKSLQELNSEVQVQVNENEQNITPWEVSSKGKIDYMKLIKQFGTEIIDSGLIEKFKRVTGKDIHPWLKRGIFFSHREFSTFLDAYENGEPVFLYTGRGPTSDAMHVGHLIPFMFTKWLQDVFDCPLVIQISDEEKAAFKKIDFNLLYKQGFENAKEIIALGFNPKKTFIFSNRDYRLKCSSYETFTSDMKMKVTMKTLQDIFGLNEESTIAMIDWPFYQTAAAFYQAYPHIFGNRPAFCLVPYAIDQDPYFRMARDIASKMNLIKPASIISTFIPPLTGQSGKMSSSVGIDATLFLTDTEDVIRAKILKHSFSGGGGNGSLDDHRKFGGNPDVDIAYQYLRYFEHDDEKLLQIHDGFKKGEISCGEMKNLLADKLISIMDTIKANRSLIDQNILDDFYSYKPMELPVPKTKIKEEMEISLNEVLDSLNIEYSTKYHAIVTTNEQAEDLARTLKGTICKALLIKGPKDAYFIYIINNATVINMKTLHKRFEVSKVNFAQRDTFTQVTKLPFTCPSLFGIINDKNKVISGVFIEEGAIPKENPVNFYSMRPDATTTISYSDMLKFIEHYKLPVKFVKE